MPPHTRGSVSLSVLRNQIRLLVSERVAGASRDDVPVGAVAEDCDGGAHGAPRHGLTLVHFSAQPEPFLTQNTP